MSRHFSRLVMSIGAIVLQMSPSVAHAGMQVLVNGDVKYPIEGGTPPCGNGGNTTANMVFVDSFSLDLRGIIDTKFDMPYGFEGGCNNTQVPCIPLQFDPKPIISMDHATLKASVKWAKSAAASAEIRRSARHHYGYRIEADSGDITHKVSGTYTLPGGGTCPALTEVEITELGPGNEWISLIEIFSARAFAAPLAQEAASTNTVTDQLPAITFADGEANSRSFYVIQRFTDRDLDIADLTQANPEFANIADTPSTKITGTKFYPSDEPPHVINVRRSVPWTLSGWRLKKWDWEVLEVRMDVPSEEEIDTWSSRTFIASRKDRVPSIFLPNLIFIVLAIGALVFLGMRRVSNSRSTANSLSGTRST